MPFRYIVRVKRPPVKQDTPIVTVYSTKNISRYWMVYHSFTFAHFDRSGVFSCGKKEQVNVNVDPDRVAASH
jgi:hypothetical protein